MGDLLILVGLPASGKSSWVQSRLEEGDVHISSDQIRKELFGDESSQKDNAKVFEVMKSRAIECLKEGKRVFYDATNISRKRRRALMNSMPKGTNFEAVYFAINPDRILANNKKRNRFVPENVIMKMYKDMQIPIKGEGFKEVYKILDNPIRDTSLREDIFYTTSSLMENKLNHEDLFSMMSKYHQSFKDVLDMSQDNSHHSFSVSRHIYYVYQNMLKNEKYGRDTDMIMASLCHDLGKAYTKSFLNHHGQERRYASFLGHENVSSQIVYEIHRALPIFDVDLVSTLCQYHMRLYDESKSNIKKLKKLVGEDVYERLVALNECDRGAK